jgi:hypothetical protein
MIQVSVFSVAEGPQLFSGYYKQVRSKDDAARAAAVVVLPTLLPAHVATHRWYANKYQVHGMDCCRTLHALGLSCGS